MKDVQSKSEIQDVIVESLVANLNQVKAERDQIRTQGQILGTIVTALLAAVSDDGTYALTPEQVAVAEKTAVNWRITPEGGIALVTVDSE